MQKSNVFGCKFSLYPMDSGFVPIILGALEQTYTTKVFSKSDAISTVYRGKLSYVSDAIRGLFVAAYQPEIHMALEGTFSQGCPWDTDVDSRLDVNGPLPNLPLSKAKSFPVKCKIALYPMGCYDFLTHIARAGQFAKEAGLTPEAAHYSTGITGDVHQIFDYLERICSYMNETGLPYALSFTLSVNSPTKNI